MMRVISVVMLMVLLTGCALPLMKPHEPVDETGVMWYDSPVFYGPIQFGEACVITTVVMNVDGSYGGTNVMTMGPYSYDTQYWLDHIEFGLGPDGTVRWRPKRALSSVATNTANGPEGD